MSAGNEAIRAMMWRSIATLLAIALLLSLIFG